MKRSLLALAVLSLLAPAIYAASPSPSGSTIPIIDCSSNSWNFVGGVVQENGKNAGYSAGVNFLTLSGCTIVQGTGKAFWGWTGSTWLPPNGAATITAAAIAASGS